MRRGSWVGADGWRTDDNRKVITARGPGALGSWAAGYKTPEEMARRDHRPLRAATGPKTFGVNSCPGTTYPEGGRSPAYWASSGNGLGDASWDDAGFGGKVAA